MRHVDSLLHLKALLYDEAWAQVFNTLLLEQHIDQGARLHHRMAIQVGLGNQGEDLV